MNILTKNTGNDMERVCYTNKQMAGTTEHILSIKQSRFYDATKYP